jgi:carbonic anhydrase
MRTIFILLSVLFIASCKPSLPDETKLSPIEKLIAGNQRFVEGKPVHPDETLERIRELKKGQHPFVIVVSCSDSRVPPELIFDQGFGDVFSVRTAGNIIGDYELGSIEYAVEHLGCKLIVVMGHRNCGAIETFVESKGCYNHFDHIRNIVEYINAEREEQELKDANMLTVDRAVEANILHGVNLLTTSEPVLSRLYYQQELKIVGAVYDINTGKVHFNIR